MPHSIVTDNGSNFDSEEFRKFCDDGGIKLKFASSLTPRPMARWKGSMV
jgi:hypothetical protein